MSIVGAVCILIVVALICAILHLPYLILGVTAVLVLIAFLAPYARF